MRRRTISTYKILTAVALVGVPACTKPAMRNDVINTETSHSATAASSAAPSPPPPVATASAAAVEDPALVGLREELSAVGHDKALASKAHYRPLCDAQGYPLVGNLNRKTSKPEYAPSEFCGEVRKGGK